MYEIIRRMIDHVVTDLVEATRDRLAEFAPASIDDIRASGRQIVAFSDPVYEEHVSLKRFLLKNLYKHSRVREMTDRAADIVQGLFTRYMQDPGQMPPEFADPARAGSERDRARVVADYVAGMTDRFAIREYERLA